MQRRKNVNVLFSFHFENKGNNKEIISTFTFASEVIQPEIFHKKTMRRYKMYIK